MFILIISLASEDLKAKLIGSKLCTCTDVFGSVHYSYLIIYLWEDNNYTNV